MTRAVTLQSPTDIHLFTVCVIITANVQFYQGLILQKHLQCPADLNKNCLKRLKYSQVDRKRTYRTIYAETGKHLLQTVATKLEMQKRNCSPNPGCLKSNSNTFQAYSRCIFKLFKNWMYIIPIISRLHHIKSNVIILKTWYDVLWWHATKWWYGKHRIL